MRIPSGVDTQYVYFVAVDASDFATRETGLSGFTVYRSRNGAAAAPMDTPTVNETNSANMPGVYELLLDEDMTIGAGNDTEEMCFHITVAGMAPVTRTIELYRPKITAGYTLGVESDGDLTKVNTLDGHTAQTGDNYARLGAPAGASISADIADIRTDTNSTIPGLIAAAQGDITNIRGRLPIALVGGKMDSDVGNMQANVIDSTVIAINAITSTKLAVDCITSDELASSAINKIRDGILDDATRFSGADIDAAISSRGTADPGDAMDLVANAVDTTSVATGAIDADAIGTAAITAAKIATDAIHASAITDGAANRLSPNIIQVAQVAVVTSPTVFTINAGSPDDDAYVGDLCIIEAFFDSTQKAVSIISDYVAATKTITLESDLGIFTPANLDAVTIMANRVGGSSLDTGVNNFDPAADTVANVTTVDTVTNQVTADVTAVSGDSGAADNLEADYDGTGYAKTNSTIGTCTTNTDMVGTNNAALATVCTEARLAELDAGNIPTDLSEIQGATFNTATDSLEAIRDRGDAAWVTGAGGDPWSTALPGAYGAGTAGKIVGDNINAPLDVIDGNVDDILTDTETTIPGTIATLQADTDDIQTRLPAALVSGRMDSNVGAISDDSTAADNLEAMYDGTGYLDDTAPASRAQVGSLAVGSGGISVTATAFVKAGAEPETNTYTATHEQDTVYHVVEDDGGSTDVYYQFNIGGTGVPQSVEWVGYVQGQNDTYSLFFYNWGGTAWEQVGQLKGSNGTSPVSAQFTATTAHVGTGANLGLVRFRIESSDGSAAATDRILCTYAVIQSSLGFVNGAVWVDTVGGESGTAEGIGTISRPVDNIADARTIADANNLKNFQVLPASSITLAQSFDSYKFIGTGYTVALGGQSLSGTAFVGATITGNDDGTNGTATLYSSCHMGTNTLGRHIMSACRFTGDITLAEAADYFWDQCYSGVAGTGTPVVDFESAAEAKNLSIRHYSGGMEFENHGAGGGTHTTSIEGFGQFVLNANCAGGTIACRGTFTVTDNAGGAVTLSDDARIDVDQITDAILDDDTQFSGADIAEILTDTDTAIPTTITTLQADTDDIQTRLPAALVGGRMDSDVGNLQADVVDADSINPDMAAELALGLAPVWYITDPSYLLRDTISAVGSSTSFTITALGATYDDLFKGSICVIQSNIVTVWRGVAVVSAYNGTTGVVTLESAPLGAAPFTGFYASFFADLKGAATYSSAALGAISGAVLDETVTQPAQEAPAATQDIKSMLAYLYKAWRNRTRQTASSYELYDDAATTVDHKATITYVANTSTERSKVGTGP